jgi:hypothetical protein
MRKFFTAIMLLAACICTNAATTVITLFEGRQALNWNDGVNIEANKFITVNEGDEITVTTSGGGMKMVANYPWTDLVSSEDAVTKYTVTADALSAIKSSGIRIQGGENVNLLKVELTTEAAEGDDTSADGLVATLLSTPEALGEWSNNIEIAGSLFTAAGVKAGDMLRIEMTIEDGAQMKICVNYPSWSDLVECFDVTDPIYTLKLDAKAIANIEADKLILQGKNATVNKVCIYRTVDSGITKTIGTSKFASFSAASNTEVPEGVSVYIAKVDGSSVVLTKVETSVIPANTGVIVGCDTEGEKTFKVTVNGSDADFSANELIATSVEENATVPTTGTYYALSATEAKFGVLTGGIKLSANKAYLAAPAEEAKQTSLNIVLAGETTGISEAAAAKTIDNSAFYTLQGVRVAKPAKGLYIHNGKKVLVK